MKRLFFAIALCALLSACVPGGVYDYEVYTSSVSGDTCVRDTVRGTAIVKTNQIPMLGLLYENGGWYVFENWGRGSSRKVTPLNLPEGARFEGFRCEKVDWVNIGFFGETKIYPGDKRRKYRHLTHR